MNKNRVWWVISFLALAAAVVQIFLSLSKVMTTQVLQDFFVYYSAGVAFLQGNDPYAVVTHAVGPMQFLYPPPALVVLAPFAVFPIGVSQVVFVVVSIVLLLVSLLVAIRLLGQKVTPQKVLLLAFLVQTFPVKFGLAMGQINFLVLFFLVFGLWLQKEKRSLDAAFFLALATVIKVIPLGLVPLLVLRKEWRLLSWWLMFTGLFCVLTPQLSIDYFSQTFGGLLQSGSSWPVFYDQSILAFFLRLNFSNAFAYWLYVVTAGVGYLFLMWRAQRLPLAKAAFILLAWLSIAAPHSWQHYLVLTYPLVATSQFTVLTLVGSWLLLAFHFPDPEAAFLKRWPVLASYQTALVVALTLISVRRQKTTQLDSLV